MTDNTVKAVHPEYEINQSQWEMNSDFYLGERAVKNSPSVLDYLPNPNTNLNDTNRESDYKYYLQSAPLLEFASRTIEAMAATINRKNPDVSDISALLEYLIEDTNGEKLSIDQHVSRTVLEVVKNGRFGLLTELPVTGDRELSRADNEAGMMPYIKGYDAQNIRYWSDSVIVLSETVAKESDSIFGAGFTTQYRVLLLENGVYSQRLYKDSENVHEYESIDITFNNGQHFDYIPFDFVGAKNNDSTVDKAPVTAIVNLNKDHFQSSAYARNIEKACSFMMLAISSNMSQSEIEERFPNGISYGSNSGHFFGEDTTIQAIQAAETNLATNQKKEFLQDAIAIGAKLVQSKEQETATAAMIANTADNSVVGQIAQNVDDAYNNQLINIALVLGDSQTSTIATNKETGLSMMTPEMRRVWIEDVMAGNVTQEDYWSAMRKAGLLDEDRTNKTLSDDTEVESIAVNEPVSSAATIDTTVASAE